MTGSSHVRFATLDDAWGIARVRVRGWQAGYKGVMPQEYLDAMSIEDNVERARRWNWSDPTIQQWVWVSDGEIQGWTCTSHPARDVDLDDTVGEVMACYALPEVWGRGVGHQMMQEVEPYLRERGADAIVLWVVEKNLRAQHFYRRQGFQLDGTSKSERLVPEVDLVSVRMRREL